MEKTSAEKQNYSEAKSAQLADNLIRQSQASALAAETIDKAKKSAAANPRQVGNVRKSLDGGFGYLNDPKEDTGHPTTDRQYRNDAYKDKVLGPVGITDKTTSKKSSNERIEVGREQRFGGGGIKTSRNLLQNNLPAPAQELFIRARATSVNISALVWAGYLYLVQIFFAIIIIVTFGIVSAIDNLTSGEGGWFAWVGKQVGDAANAVTSLFGFDLASIALPFFFISEIIILAIGLITVMALYLQYKINGLNPFFGKGAGLKIGMLILVFVGYTMPVFNLFPWIGFWMAAVWLYPR